jgi:hypothetical protein
MENLLFELLVYVTVICFICCFQYRPYASASVPDYQPIDLSPIWDSDPDYQPIDLSPIWDSDPDESTVLIDPIQVKTMTSRELRSLASDIQLSGYSRILREQKTEGLRQAILEKIRR